LSYEVQSGLRLTPKRWFLGDDQLIRPIWRSFLFVVLAVILLYLITGAIRGLGIGVDHPMRFPVTYAASSAGLLLQTWFLLTVLDRRSFRAAGLWFYSGWGKEALWGFGLGAGLMIGVTAVLAATGSVRFALGGGAWPQLLGGVATLGGILVLAAAFEEILFRGYPFQRLVDSIGPVGATAVFASLFGLGHLGNPGATPLSTANTVLAGVLLAAAYLKTRALWLPIGLHWAWNFMMGPVLGLPVSGIEFPRKLLHAEISGPAWWSGGVYGPEGGLALTAFCAALAIWLARTRRISPSPAMKEVLK